MKQSGKVAIWLAGGLMWHSGSVTAESNPYASIVDRNVFNLKPAPVVAPVDPNPPAPPSKIVLLGIVSGIGLGPKQVMFKTPVGTPPKETSFTLDEGERKDEFEVVEINEVNESVRLKNHGIEQTLTLKDDGMKPAGGPPPLPVPGAPGLPGGVRLPPPIPGGPATSAMPAPTGGSTVTTFGAGANIPNRPVRGLATTSGAPGFGSAGRTAENQTQKPLTPEEQIVLMEVNRELTKKQVAEGTMPPLPPTPLTEPPSPPK